MSRRRRLLLLAGALVVGLAACSVGVGTPPDEYAAEHRADQGGGGGGGGNGGDADVDLLVDGPEQAIADLRAEIGGEQIQAYLVAIDPDAVFVEVPNADDPSQSDRYKWDVVDGVTPLGTRAVSAGGLEPFALNSIDYAALPDLVAEAPGAAGVNGQVTSHVDVRRTGGQTLITVSMVTPRGDTGAVVADANGQIIGTS